MTPLLLGLLLVLGIHSVHLVAPAWHARITDRLGRRTWLWLHSLLSLLGTGLLVWGYLLTREQPILLWSPPPAMRAATVWLMLPAFVLWLAALVPGNHLKARLRQPLVLGILLWAVAHLLATATLVNQLVLLTLLLWGVLDFVAVRRQERQGRQAASARAAAAPVRPAATLLVWISGAAAWWIFGHWVHGWLIGIRPMPWL